MYRFKHIIILSGWGGYAKAKRGIACILMLTICLVANAQNNPFKIKDNLYKKYQKLYPLRNKKEVLDEAERLYREALEEKDDKAACIALTLPIYYHFYQQHNLGEFDNAAERLKNEALRTGHLQYYFFAMSQRVTLLLNMQFYLLAAKAAKDIRNDAERLDNDYGRYMFIRAMAKIHQIQNDTEKARQYFIRSYHFAKEKLKDQDLAALCNFIAEIYMMQRKFTEALKWCDEGIACVKLRNNLPKLICTTIKTLYAMERHEECLQTYETYKEDLKKIENMPIWTETKVRLLCCEKKYDEAYEIATKIKNKADALGLQSLVETARGDYDKALELQRNMYEIATNLSIRQSYSQGMSELDAALETERLNVERLKLNNEYVMAELRNAETARKLKLQETANLWMQHHNDSAALVRLKTDSASTAYLQTSNAIKQRTALAMAENKRITEIFLVIVAALLAIYATVTVIVLRKRIKAIKMRNAQLCETLEKAKEAQRMQDTFIKDLSFEVRTPLNDVMGFSQLLLDDSIELNGEDKALIGSNIEHSSEKLTTMVNDLLKKALKESSAQVAKTICLLLSLATATAMAQEYKHADIEILKNQKRTLQALNKAYDYQQKAMARNDWQEAFDATCDLSAICEYRGNIPRATECAEEALEKWRNHRLKCNPAHVMLTLGRHYRQWHKIEKAEYILGKAATYCHSDSLRLMLDSELAYLAFELNDSANFMKHYSHIKDTEQKSTAKLGQDEDAILEIQHRFFRTKSINEIERLNSYTNRIELYQILHLRTIMLINLNMKNKALESLAAEFTNLKKVRAGIFELDRKEMEEETNNKILTADNLRLQLENTRLKLEERENMARLESEMAEKLKLQRVKDELQRKQTEANVTRGKVKTEMERRHAEELYAQNELTDKRMTLIGAATIIIILLVAIYSYLHSRNMRIIRTKNEAIDKALKEVEESEMKKKTFIQNMSHEIRTPLNAIVGFSQIILMSGDELSEEEKKMFAENIRSNGELLTQIVEDIIDASELENNDIEISIEDVAPRLLCITAIETVRHREKDNVPIMLSTTLTDDFTVKTSKKRVMQVLINFLTNAIKHTDAGHITIGCNTDEYPGNICFFVEDTGEGIPADKRDTVFERFVKLDTFHQGTGLGLNICKRIAERLDAKVMVDPQYNNGARFLLVIPLR